MRVHPGTTGDNHPDPGATPGVLQAATPPRRDLPGTGLTSAQARRRLTEYGPNRPPAPPANPWYLRVWAQLRDPMILLLLGAGALTAVLHQMHNTVIIAAVVIFNTLTGVVQEMRADRAVAAVGELRPPLATVRRDGSWRDLPTEQLVPGDVVSLAAGDLVPADGPLLSAVGLQLDESSMTGEALPTSRVTGELLTGGTLVTRGRGLLAVERTGAASGLGRLASVLAETPTRATPLQRRLSRLSRHLVIVAAGLTGVVTAIGLAQGRPFTEMAVIGVSLAVAAVPESLPAVLVVALALGARRMARRNAVVRRLPAVETLGSVTVVATDKTGTITQGRMVAEHVWVPPLDEPDRARDRLLRDIVLCNDATPAPDDGRPAPPGEDPLEVALLRLAGIAGVDIPGVRGAWPRVAEEPFDAVSRRMETTHEAIGGATRLTVSKGAPETIMALLPRTPQSMAATRTAEDLAAEGYRVLAVVDDADGSMTLAGLVAVDDPPREHAREVVRACRRAGIRLLLVTGDHPGTARSIAERVGITDSSVPAPGEPDVVYARVRPEQKVAIVRDLQAEGEVVAMLGDGVNDAPALRTADIGVAAGRTGTEVARQAADVVLLDDDLGTVVAAIEEGRRIFANIQSFLLYAVSGGLAEIAVMLLGPATGIALPLLPAQILWINLMTHGLTGVAFGAEPADPALMRRPPVPRNQAMFTRPIAARLLVAAAALTIVSLSSTRFASALPEARTSIFLSLGLGQLGVAWAIRSRPPGLRRLRTRGLELAAVTGAVLLAAASWAPPLQEFFGTHSLDLVSTLWVVGLAALPGLLLRALTQRGWPQPGRGEDPPAAQVGAPEGVGAPERDR